MKTRVLFGLVAPLVVALGVGCQSHRAVLLSVDDGEARPPAGRERRPVPAIERALVISIDGGRPDVLLRADMPNLRRLVEAGAFTFWARTVPVAITLPSHTSMLTGVSPEKHGVTWNGDDHNDDVNKRPNVPTLFEVAMRYDMTTGMVAGKRKFIVLARDGTIGRAWVQRATDEEVADAAVQMLREYRPEVLFVHFPGADVAGHGAGWGSPEQVQTLAGIDVQIGKLLAGLDETAARDKTVILVSADHGGSGVSHGIDFPYSEHIPWIVSGPGIRAGYDLTRDAALRVGTEDTFATVCFLLGIAPVDAVEGKAIEQVVAKTELLRDAP